MSKTVHTYSDGVVIGEIDMTDDQLARYIAESDRDTGAILFRDLMAYGLPYTASEIVSGDTTVYVSE